MAALCDSLKRPACHVLFRLFQPLQSELDSDRSRFALKRVFNPGGGGYCHIWAI